MRIILSIVLSFLITTYSYGWGQTGHRVVGSIAEFHLSKKARKNLKKILGNESIAMAGNFMDEIKSDSTFDHYAPWHYCTIPDGKTYEQAGTPDEGDIINAINLFINELKSKDFSSEDEAFALKCLIHLVADIHQPLHVGNGADRGGNDVRVEYFWNNSNLHRVWDTGIINGQNLSYTEYTTWINHATKSEINGWQSDGVLEWAYESKAFRKQVYNLPENHKINYEYNYNNIDLVNQRLLQAGIRLAKVLNDIYG